MMKKFLSSLLALTMILSLVIVPANATGGTDIGTGTGTGTGTSAATGSATLSITGATGKGGHAKVGDTLTFALTNPVVNDSSVKVISKNINLDSVTWKVDSAENNGSYEVTTADAGKTLTVSYTAEIDYTKEDGLHNQGTGSVRISGSKSVTVDPEKPADTYTVSKPVITVKVNGNVTNETSFPKGTALSFSVAAPTVTKNDETMANGYDLEYTWTGAKQDSTVKTTATATPTEKGSLDVTCTVNVKVDGKQVATNSAVTKLTITDPQADFDKATKTVTYKGRSYEVKNNEVTIDLFGSETIANADLAVSATGVAVVKGTFTAAEGNNDATLEIKSKDNSELTVTVTLKTNAVKGAKVDIKKDGKVVTEPIEIVTGQEISLTPAYDKGNATVSKPTYKWKLNTGNEVEGSSYKFSEKTDGDYTITCNVYEGTSSVVAATKEVNVKVGKDTRYPYAANNDKEKYTLASGDSQTLTDPVLKDEDGKVYTPDKVEWSVSAADAKIVSIDTKTAGKCKVTALNKSGTATVKATITYDGKKYEPLEYKFTVKALDTDLDGIVNGSDETYRQRNLESILEDIIGEDVTSIYYVSGSAEHVTLKVGGSTISSSKKIDDDLTIYADRGVIGTGSFQLLVNGKTVTLNVPIEGKEKIDETVTGTSVNSSVSIKNSDYKYLFVYTGSNFSDDLYNGEWNKNTSYSAWKKVAENGEYKVDASAFKNKTSVTLYVVGVDDDGVASTGKITVSQKSYAVKYSVVAGETLSFDQKAFESFMEAYAEDNISSKRGDYFELQYVKFTSLPNSTKEGDLYEGKNKIKTSTEVEDLDKVTFESVAKANGTIKIPFTLYAKQYDKSDKVIDNKVSMTGEVEITVVKEDIVYEVGVNSFITFDSADFLRYVKSAATKNTKLDYVTFEVGKNGAISSVLRGTGALYSSYTTYGVNTFAKASDKFYYEAKRNQDALDDVTYATTNLAKVGDVVYIPFTAVTDSGKEYTGSVAIKVKQTMNFVDVRPGDYFYDSVQWAVNLGITKGTSATTFSPKTGCTRAQIVTFLWRAAKSPEPRSNTSKFTDVYATAHADYMKAINWATEQGITTGTGNGKFSPDATCTRAQIVTFLYRYKNNPAVYGSLNFSDVNKTEHAAFYNAILWAVNNKITTGYGNGIFDPNGTCNRGDAVTFLYRALA